MFGLLTCLNIICISVQLLLGFFQLAMLLRALLSFFNPEESGLFAALLYMVTEPAIMPVRALMTRLHIGENLPIDLSFIVTVLLLSVIGAFLPAISLA